jgi:hypothetical protein
MRQRGDLLELNRQTRRGQAELAPACEDPNTSSITRTVVHPFEYPQVRGARKELEMSIDIFMNDTCPKCRKPIKSTTVTPDSTRRENSFIKAARVAV